MSMKLKDIVKEISLMSGDAGNDSTSAELMDDFVGENSKFGAIVKRLYGKDSAEKFWSGEQYWLAKPEVKNNPLDGRLIGFIKDNAFDSQGSYYIVRNKVDDRIWHNLFDISQPAELVYAGRIETSPSTGPYSMKRIYGVEGQIVHWSNIAREYKGAGFGAFLYDTLLYKYGVLESDSILYQGSRAMWSKHIPKVASFFGGTIGLYRGGTESEEPTVVIPLNGEDVNDKTFIGDTLGSFVAFHGNVPAGIKQIAKLTSGLSARNGTLGIVVASHKLDAPIDEYTNAGIQIDRTERSTFLDILDTVSFDELIDMFKDANMSIDTREMTNLAKAKKMLMLFVDATVFVEPKGDGIKYELIQ
jgi:hypothetical protein